MSFKGPEILWSWIFAFWLRALEYCLDVEKLNLSAIRTVRVLRPLRAINRIPSKPDRRDKKYSYTFKAVGVEWKSYEAGCKNSVAQSFFSPYCTDRTVHYLKNCHQFMAIQSIFYSIEDILWRLIATQAEKKQAKCSSDSSQRQAISLPWVWVSILNWCITVDFARLHHKRMFA